MACKINHALPDAIPQFLCRACHPELVPTPEQRAAEAEQYRQTLAAENADMRRRQELLRAQSRLSALERRHKGDIGGVDARVAEGLRAKIERLERGEDDKEQSKSGSSGRVRKRKASAGQSGLAKRGRATRRRTTNGKA